MVFIIGGHPSNFGTYASNCTFVLVILFMLHVPLGLGLQSTCISIKRLKYDMTILNSMARVLICSKWKVHVIAKCKKAIPLGLL